LLADWAQWQLVYLDEGQTSIFLWHDPRDPANTGPSLPRFDPAALAFGPNAVRAPEVGPERLPRQPDLLDRFLRGPAETPAQTALVQRYLDYYQLVRQLWPVPALVTAELGSWTGTVSLAPATPAAATVAAPGTYLLTSVLTRAALARMPMAQALFL